MTRSARRPQKISGLKASAMWVDEVTSAPDEAFTGQPSPAGTAGYECGFCRRGQCARCSDPDCTCCNGNPDA